MIRFVYLIVLIALLIPAIVLAQPDLNRGLVAYYPFNGNDRDASGNKNNPVFNNTTYTTDKWGNTRNACLFNGKDQYIKIRNSSSLNFTGAMSISVWVKVNDFYTGKCHGNRILMKADRDYLDGTYLLGFDDNFYTKATNCDNYQVDTKHQTFYGQATASTKLFVSTGKWYLLTYTYDGKYARLYADCDLLAETSLPHYQFTNEYDIYLGHLNDWQYPYWFNGIMDELRIYNRCLSAEEITALCLKSNTVVSEIPVADFSYTISKCKELNVLLSPKSNAKQYEWRLNGKTIGRKNKFTYSVTGPGSYTLVLTGTDVNGRPFSVKKSFELEKPDTRINYQLKKEPGTYFFSCMGKKAYKYTWYLNDTLIGRKRQKEYTFYRSNSYTVRLEAEDKNGCTGSTEKTIPVAVKIMTEPAPSLPQVQDAPPPAAVVDEVSSASFPDKRENILIRTFDVKNDSVTVSFYDNAEIDGDTISIIYNHAIIASHIGLTDKPLTYTFRVLGGEEGNELVMYAENLGSIPPNTALMIIYDGETRHELTLTSTNSVNSMVRFRLKR